MEINIEPILTCALCIADGARISPQCAVVRTLCLGTHLCQQARRLAAGKQLTTTCRVYFDLVDKSAAAAPADEERIDTPQPRHTATADAKPERRPYMTADE